LDALWLAQLRRVVHPFVGAITDPSAALIFWIAVVLVGGIGFGVLISSKCRSIILGLRRQESPTAHDQLLTSLAGFGHSGVARANLERLAQYSETRLETTDPRYTAYRQRFVSIVQTYRDFTAGLLGEIVRLSGRYSAWQVSASELRKHTAVLNQILLGGAADSASYHERAGEIISSASRSILRCIKDLRRAVIADYNADVASAVNRVMAAKQEHINELGIREVSVFCRGTSLAHADQEVLKTCLEILITNSVEAMENSTQRRLRLTVETEAGDVLIRVEDTGSGLERKDWERIFERNVTTKGPGHGLGLYHVRHRLARYGGSVRVESSSVGDGTVMLIRLRAVDRHTDARSETAAEGKVPA
jgi:signal transduction histidine kinase